MSKTTDKAAGLYQSARDNEYVNRLIEDRELRENVLEAIQSARNAYGRIADDRKGPFNAVTNNKRVQKDLRTAADSLREASEALTTPKKKKKKRLGKFLLLAVVSLGVVLAVSEDARKALLDALFGPEEEFEYTSSTTAETATGNGEAL